MRHTCSRPCVYEKAALLGFRRLDALDPYRSIHNIMRIAREAIFPKPMDWERADSGARSRSTLNPIEMAFAKLEAHLCARAIRTIDALWKAIGQICDLFTRKNAQITSLPLDTDSLEFPRLSKRLKRIQTFPRQASAKCLQNWRRKKRGRKPRGPE